MTSNDSNTSVNEEILISSFNFESSTKTDNILIISLFFIITILSLFGSTHGPESINSYDTTNILENKGIISYSSFNLKFTNIKSKNKYQKFYILFRRFPNSLESNHTLILKYSFKTFLNETLIFSQSEINLNLNFKIKEDVIESFPILFHRENYINYDVFHLNVDLEINSNTLGYSTIRWIYENPNFYEMINISLNIFSIIQFIYLLFYLFIIYFKPFKLRSEQKQTIILLLFSILSNNPLYFLNESLTTLLISSLFLSSFYIYFFYFLISLLTPPNNKKNYIFYFILIFLIEFISNFNQKKNLFLNFFNINFYILIEFFLILILLFFVFFKAFIAFKNYIKTDSQRLLYHFGSISIILLIWGLCNFYLILDPTLNFTPFKSLFTSILLNMFVLFLAEIHYPINPINSHFELKKGRSSSAWSYSPNELNFKNDKNNF